MAIFNMNGGGGGGIKKITTAGIYWNENLGLISISGDGTNRTTIADKNLGATSVRNYGDSKTEEKCGCLYQRGNNYGFPYKSATNVSSGKIDATNYGPGNYYASTIFIGNTDYYWDSSDNRDLWGGVTNTNIAKRGPCQGGYHIGDKNERGALINLGVNIGAWVWGNNNVTRNNMVYYLKIPFANSLGPSSGTITTSSNEGNYRTSKAYGKNKSEYVRFSSKYISTDTMYRDRSRGYSIRPFKDIPVQPDNTWTVLYQPS